MEAKYLRIGNYVTTEIHGPGTVSAISGTSILYSRNYDSIEIYKILPVAINKEWLVNSGFEAKANNWFELKYFTDCQETAEIFLISYNLKTGRFAVSDFEEEQNPIYTGKIIKEIHNLQNILFALTGQEI